VKLKALALEEMNLQTPKPSLGLKAIPVCDIIRRRSRIDPNAPNGKITKPLVVRRNNIPGRAL
jgi:hypothetical protein